MHLFEVGRASLCGYTPVNVLVDWERIHFDLNFHCHSCNMEITTCPTTIFVVTEAPVLAPKPMVTLWIFVVPRMNMGVLITPAEIVLMMCLWKSQKGTSITTASATILQIPRMLLGAHARTFGSMRNIRSITVHPHRLSGSNIVSEARDQRSGRDPHFLRLNPARQMPCPGSRKEIGPVLGAVPRNCHSEVSNGRFPSNPPITK